MTFCVNRFSFPLDIDLGVKLLDLIVTLCLRILGTAKMFSKMAAPLYNSTKKLFVW